MANSEHVAKIGQGVNAWNTWRTDPLSFTADIDLSGADLSYANLRQANLSNTNLRGANLHGADLTITNLIRAELGNADLQLARMNRADLESSGPGAGKPRIYEPRRGGSQYGHSE